MPVSIRLKRMGRKGRPFYRVVVADTRTPMPGMAIDDIGYYDPMQDPPEIKINEEKALKWLKDGSKPTDTVRSIFSKTGLLKRYHQERHSIEEPEEEPVEKQEEPKEEQVEPEEKQEESEEEQETDQTES